MYAIRWQYGSFLALLATLATCEKPAAQQVQKNAQQTVAATQVYVNDVQKDFENQARKQLQELSASIDQLGANVQNGADGALRQRLKMLNAQRDELQASIDHLHDKTGGAWETMHDGVSKALTQLKASYDDASTQLKK